jgi:hypothetical protein
MTTMAMRYRSIAVLLIALPLAGCGGDAGSGTTGGLSGVVSADTTAESTTSAAPTVDKAVVRWKKRWAIKIQQPMRHAVLVLHANALSAVSGNSAAAYRLTPAFNKLSNCRNPLELPPLSPTPSVLRKARKLTLSACRDFFVGVDGVIAGLNMQDSAAAQAGIRRINNGERTLRNAARVVKTAPTTTTP